ncbi:hypothetical protein HZI31_20670 [Serratia fonticola]|uniref:PIN-like domain-containing protein n=1 Tax=Serratia fonticola TaxID=47917 RepID=UPI0015C669B8|nr:PIN-like domain-containing protein [Serratia fonticola]NYA45712.1 hypothetical protein [Serratia fonticola]
MRNTFRGFYSLNDTTIINNVWNSDKTIFVFDTNCLLNLYRCEDKTRDDILDVMSKISERIWLPFFVCLEYQKNRRTVITDSINNLNLIKNSLNDVVTSVTKSLSTGNVKKHLYNALSESVHALQNDIKPLIDNFITSHIDTRIDSKEKVNKRDIIRERIDVLVNEKCGSPPTPEWINNVNNEGVDRYKKLIPPGFMDASKTGKKYYYDLEFEEKYGDLYIWMEIINKSKKDNIENIIFICDDRKKDWWYETKGVTHGALEALQTEIYTESGIKNFKLITQATFLHNAQEYLPNININSDSLKEVQQISDSQNDIRNVITSGLNSTIMNSLSNKLRETLENSVNEQIKSRDLSVSNVVFGDNNFISDSSEFISAKKLTEYQDQIESNISKLRDVYNLLIVLCHDSSEKNHEYMNDIIELINSHSDLNVEIFDKLKNNRNTPNIFLIVRTSLAMEVSELTAVTEKLLSLIKLKFDI